MSDSNSTVSPLSWIGNHDAHAVLNLLSSYISIAKTKFLKKMLYHNNSSKLADF